MLLLLLLLSTRMSCLLLLMQMLLEHLLLLLLLLLLVVMLLLLLSLSCQRLRQRLGRTIMHLHRQQSQQKHLCRQSRSYWHTARSMYSMLFKSI
jgi:hypothetical protein